MSDAHSRGVTKNRLQLENSLDDGYWDKVFIEKSYYKNQDHPHVQPIGDKGREVGEFDYLAVNNKDKVFLYGEVKSSPKDLGKAGRQLNRAEEFFSPEWKMIGQTWLEEQV